MKKIGYFSMVLLGFLFLYCGIVLWKEGKFVDSIWTFLLGLTFVVVFASLVFLGRVGWVGRLLGLLSVGHLDQERDK